MRRVVFNQKGGVGKTSITCNMAAISAARGHRTLVIDLDVQCNSSEYLLGDKCFDVEGTSVDFFKQYLSVFNRNTSHGDVIHFSGWANLYIMPAHPELAMIERELESRHKIFKLRDALIELSNEFDHIYIDTPPALNFYSRTALIACDRLLIPYDCDSFSGGALYNLIDTVHEVRADHNPDLLIEGIVVNQYHPQAKLPQAMIKDMESDQLPILNSYLSSSVKIKESRMQQTPLEYMAPSHKLTLQYNDLFDELEELNAT